MEDRTTISPDTYTHFSYLNVLLTMAVAAIQNQDQGFSPLLLLNHVWNHMGQESET